MWEVSLLEGSAVYDLQERMRRFLLGTNPDQWLVNFRRAAGLPLRGAPDMTGWEAPDGLLRGHSTGHYLSALALCYQTTGDPAVYMRAAELVDALAACRDALAGRDGIRPGYLAAYSEEQFDLLEELTPYPKIWAPYYTLHKLLAGLLDAWDAGIEAARPLAEGLGGWVAARLGRLDRARREQMWRLYIAGEYGGLNESMAELYRRTGNAAYLETARYFDNDRLLGPLLAGTDALDGLHANQHIPQMLGAVKLYELTGEARYRTAAERFWRFVTASHAYAFGGVGEGEMFHAPGRVAGLLTARAAESCASHNMLKLSASLFRLRPDAAYLDYYERTLWNHILAACDPLPEGGNTYFLPLLPGAVKRVDRTEHTCCQGTGMESAFRTAENVFFPWGADGVMVGLYLPARLRRENGTLTMRAAAEEPGRVRLTVEPVQASAKTALRLRVPDWAGTPSIRVNGVARAAAVRDGWIELETAGRAEVEADFPASLRFARAPDDPACFTVHFGPYVLAALSDREERLRLCPDAADFERMEGLAFRHRESGTRLVPLAAVREEAYQLYFSASE